MENLRVDIEADLHDSIEGEFKMPVVLMSPDAEEQHYSLLNPSELLGGRIQYSQTQVNPNTGEPVVVDLPVVTLRIASLIRVPEVGERWIIRMPVSPRPGATVSSFTFGMDKASIRYGDIGFIVIYPQKIEEEVETYDGL